jgi:hypothetical protein
MKGGACLGGVFKWQEKRLREHENGPQAKVVWRERLKTSDFRSDTSVKTPKIT